ncbi:hypothetical protein CgunFtcFv8_007844 [Champsocephalus gunnari]|uniref:Uncharacterized protein n=1 Tax=Champsocephalus gunnari TaxID=52237 RepID=A0AAN8D2N3_CHAGU|nr:hypothetical protein CgunFtcFv8_007844 [Champsocephalus gunnari]
MSDSPSKRSSSLPRCFSRDMVPVCPGVSRCVRVFSFHRRNQCPGPWNASLCPPASAERVHVSALLRSVSSCGNWTLPCRHYT